MFEYSLLLAVEFSIVNMPVPLLNNTEKMYSFPFFTDMTMNMREFTKMCKDKKISIPHRKVMSVFQCVQNDDTAFDDDDSMDAEGIYFHFLLCFIFFYFNSLML